jgi:hypothetical protein
MEARTPRIYSALNPFVHGILICSVVPKYLKSATPSKDLFAIFMLCLCPAFLQHDNKSIFAQFSLDSLPDQPPY